MLKMANFGGSVISHVPDIQRIVLLHFQQISVFFLHFQHDAPTTG